MNCECDAHFIRCCTCGKIFKCSRYDTLALMEHIKTEHTGQAGQAEVSNLNGNDKVASLRSLAAQHGISNDRITQISKMTGMTEEQLAVEANRYLTSRESVNERRSSVQFKQTDSKILNKRRLYRSSIEKWIPTDGPIYCPECGCSSPPTIKTHSQLDSSSSCCASCILSCWPFCFLPCILPSDNREYLHCCKCKNFLGLYDRENNCIKPNRAYIECDCPYKDDEKSRDSDSKID